MKVVRGGCKIYEALFFHQISMILDLDIFLRVFFHSLLRPILFLFSTRRRSLLFFRRKGVRLWKIVGNENV